MQLTVLLLSCCMVLICTATRHSAASRKHLRIGSLHEPPYVFFRLNDKNEPVQTDGLDFQVLLWLAKRLNFTYSLKYSIGGYGLKLNGQWTGLIRMLVDDDIDVALAPLTVIYLRYQVSDFTYPVLLDPTAIMVPYPEEQDKMSAIIKPFQPMIWLLLVISLLTVAALLTFSSTSAGNRKSPLGLFFDHLLFVFLILSSQGATLILKKHASKILLSAWCLAVFVLTYSYTGTLVSFLIKPTFKPTVETLEELAKSSALTPAIPNGTIHEYTFLNSTQEPFKTIGQKLLSKPGTFVPSAQCSAKVATGRYACMMEQSALELYKWIDWRESGRCRVILARETFAVSLESIMLAKNSPYTKDFDKGIIWMHDVGLIQYWKKLYWPKPNLCDKVEVPAKAQLKLADLTGAFLVYGTGVSVSLMAFLLELARRSTRKP